MTQTSAPNSAVAPPRRPVLRWMRKRLQAWLLRHQLPFNLRLHMVGIPLAVAGVVLLFFAEWYWGVAAIFVGYLLQYIGHRAEGNDVGEWAGIKRLLGLPYVGISPRWQKQAGDSTPRQEAQPG